MLVIRGEEKKSILWESMYTGLFFVESVGHGNYPYSESVQLPIEPQNRSSH